RSTEGVPDLEVEDSDGSAAI
ncbi:hypothetical protein A2U01_0101815, partial [Trifolium medium]|nr:hypothetical protein [Trifolium medium]